MHWRLLAHPDGPLQPHDLWGAWNFEAWLLISLGALIFIYAWGTRTLWGRAGVGRGISRRRSLSFLAAILALVVALVSPLDALSGALFSAHMTQHMILMVVAAPLLVLSDISQAFLWALPRPAAKSLGQSVHGARPLTAAWKFLAHPVCAWSLFTIVLWTFHASALYEAALEEEALHVLEHFVFVLTAMLFWWVLFKHTRQKHVQYGMAIPYLFLTVLQSGILGALMTFSAQPWYPYYTASAELWGLTALQDQQLAGLIMWIPGGAVFTLFTIGYFAAWLRALEERSTRTPHASPLPTHQELH